MTTAKYKVEDLSVRWKGGELFHVDKDVISRLGRSVERANDSIRLLFDISRSGSRKLHGLVQGTWPRRASKGWRKHVRRMKAKERR